MIKKIRECMTRDVQTAHPDTTLREAATIMKDRNIGSLPICEGKRVVGILTDRDITIRAVARGVDPNQVKVGDVMTREVVVCKADDSMGEATRLMHDLQLRRLPIVDPNGDLIGFLALARVAREESTPQVGRVLKGVSHPSTPRPMASYRQGHRKRTG